MKLILSERAYRSIVNECRSVVETETGGILVGKKIDEQHIVVPFSLGPGLKAKRSRYRYSPDVKWQQVYLDKLFDRYGIDYIGSFHLHPGDRYLPSYQDLNTARRITSDPEWNVAQAIFPIINITGNRIRFYPYLFYRSSRGFQSIDWQVVAHNDELIKFTLKGDRINETKNHSTTRPPR
jgi:integrative and conjugative element protein (TIGR02256 family)